MVIASWEDETGLVGATAPPSKLAARFHLPHSQLGALIAPFAAPNSPYCTGLSGDQRDEAPLEAEEEASNRPATARCKMQLDGLPVPNSTTRRACQLVSGNAGPGILLPYIFYDGHVISNDEQSVKPSSER
ncbi:hypothetical protein OPV22_023200 [Ensete ventricosum]|uniref:Uncharacterized protein n=1 Tax=Ensete ventricosum TaxID=4639 RepID=A0AAV8QWC9_ENSVE|nr:hypothetical protein OPV22_023200 [Ensete ventricosum]